MIFATVGMQMPFTRLVRTFDSWAEARGRTDVFAQIGRTDARPSHVEWTEFLDVGAYRERLNACDIVITHAGMGTILTALEFSKPIIIMPRRDALRETRNDHQLATARSLSATTGIRVAWDEEQLVAALDAAHTLPAPTRIGRHASMQLMTTVRDFIQGAPTDADATATEPLRPVVRAPWFTEQTERAA